MPMPEAAIHKNDCFSAGEHKIGLSRQIAVMKPVSPSQGMKTPAHDHLRLRVCAPDASHHPAAHVRRYDIRQEPSSRPEHPVTPDDRAPAYGG